MKRLKKETIGNNPQKRDGSDANDADSLPLDLIIEILVKLPPKSLAKLICVSKLWSSIIRSKRFIDLFLNRSLTRPKFLFTSRHDNSQIFLSASQEAPSFGRRTASITPMLGRIISPPVRGLICSQIASKVTISNPSTGQFVNLPKVKTRRRRISSFFGYDPVKDEYKVLSMTVVQVAYNYGPVVSEEHQVFTLGKTQKRWRLIKCEHPHCPLTQGLCMDGVLYYIARANSHRKGVFIVRFDVRLEEFSVVKLPVHVETNAYGSELVNYEKKIVLMNESDDGEVEFWVLEDSDKEEWSKILVVVPFWDDLVGNDFFTCRGIISSGEFIFTPETRPDPFYIISYDRKRDIAKRVVIEGFGERFRGISVFLDHVECPILL